jgi:hypothetical protein
MQANKIAKQVIDFQKMSFDSWFSALTLMQDQATMAMNTMIDQARWMPQDGRDAVQNWMGVIQDERTRLKGYVDDSFVTLEKALTAAPKTAAKAKKASN